MNDIIQDKLNSYICKTQEDEENALKEITQEVILYGLKEVGFFEKAAFHGGTCLRINHGLDRFSEDLDFALNQPDSHFELEPYLKKAVGIINAYGYNLEVTGADKADRSVKSRFLKDSSIKQMLQLTTHLDLRKKIQIKIEVDINPPGYAVSEVSYLDFPTDCMIKIHDLPTLAAGKCHALLCREYIKGRDWYDYLWYLRKDIQVNLKMLQVALNQQGPWKGQNRIVTPNWLRAELEKKIQVLNWEEVKKDVSRFLQAEQRKGLDIWSEEFFLYKTKQFLLA